MQIFKKKKFFHFLSEVDCRLCNKKNYSQSPTKNDGAASTEEEVEKENSSKCRQSGTLCLESAEAARLRRLDNYQYHHHRRRRRCHSHRRLKEEQQQQMQKVQQMNWTMKFAAKVLRLKERFIIGLAAFVIVCTFLLVMDLQLDLGYSGHHLLPSHGRMKMSEDPQRDTVYNNFRYSIFISPFLIKSAV